MPHRAVIGLGSNIGVRAFYLELADLLIGWEVGCVVRRSSVIETPAWGFESDPFLNRVIVVETELDPLPLLDALQSIERRLGRTEKSTVAEDGSPIYHARTIDLELPAGAYTLYSDTVAPDVAKAARKQHGRKAPLTLEPRETKADTFIGARESRTHKGGVVKVTIPCNGGFVIVQ